MARFDEKGKTNIFQRKYCVLLVLESFTKFIGPAKLVLNQRIYFFIFFLVLWFLCWWSLQRGQLKKSPCRCTKVCYKIKRKILAISVKLDLQSFPLIPYIFIKRYTWSIKLETFFWKIEQFLNLFVSKLCWGSPKMSTK